jgi:glucose/arabinose dehydrogenase
MNRKIIGFFVAVFIMIILMMLHAQDNSEGEDLYKEYCATCHGSDLAGGNAQSLVDGDWQFGSKRSHHFRNTKFGILERGMPGFEESLSDDQINDILDYLEDKEGSMFIEKPEYESRVKTLDYKINVETWVADLEIPWAIDFIDPGTALITERPGTLRMVVNGRLRAEAVVGTPQVLHAGQGGLMDVAVDPEYAQNGWIYLAYSHTLAEDDDLAMTRIVRGRIQDNKWMDQEVLYQADPKHYSTKRHHYGSRIVFDQKGFLYFAVGDRGARKQAQDLSRPNGKIHRIHRDGKIPQDNPFVNKENALPTIFTYGNRNPQGLAIHPETDMLWETEHGPMGGDEVNLLKPGINYGWPVITYGLNYNGTIISEHTEKPGMQQPVLYWKPSTATCGLDFYRGDLFKRWKNDLIVGALKYEDVRILSIEDDRVMHEEIILKNYGRVRDVACGPDGAIYVVLNEPGNILRLTPIDRN